MNSAQTPHHHDDHHGHGHEHGHHHHHHHGASGNIGFAFILNFGFSLIELAGGLWIGSVAVAAGAVHDFGDSVSLAIAWMLERLANRNRDARFNFGYRRFSLLSALISGVVISTSSVLILGEALLRLRQPEVPAGRMMIIFALMGLLINGLAAWRVSRGSTQNEKVLTWHLMQDLLSWAVILLGAGVVWLTGWTWVDPVLAIAVSVFILTSVVRYLKATAYLFLQGRPESFSEAEFLREVLAMPGIEHVDHLAVWSLDGEFSVLSARLHLHNVSDPLEIERVKSSVRALATRQKAQATLETCLAEQGHEVVE